MYTMTSVVADLTKRPILSISEVLKTNFTCVALPAAEVNYLHSNLSTAVEVEVDEIAVTMADYVLSELAGQE
jgi:hypothetical protein